ncbi:hypothetical protein ACA910_011100 [Epithemia clementina (nom. ined.)]
MPLSSLKRRGTHQQQPTPAVNQQEQEQQQQQQQKRVLPTNHRVKQAGQGQQQRVVVQTNQKGRRPTNRSTAPVVTDHHDDDHHHHHGHLLWKSVTITLVFNMVGFFISVATGWHVHLDLLGAGAFFFSLLPSLPLAKHNTRIAYSSFAVGLWSLRLTAFLFYRALVVQHDGRLTTTLSTVQGTLLFWTISAVWGVGTALPHTLGTTNARHAGYTITNVLGMILFFVGWLVETVADLQKWSFQQHAPPHVFCNLGLWKWSQHPNWFGDLLLWTGIFVLNLPSLVIIVVVAGSSSSTTTTTTTAWRSARRVGCALLSPLILVVLFYGQATGRISNARQKANERYGYGTDPVYTEYVDTTPLIVPNNVVGVGMGFR